MGVHIHHKHSEWTGLGRLIFIMRKEPKQVIKSLILGPICLLIYPGTVAVIHIHV